MDPGLRAVPAAEDDLLLRAGQDHPRRAGHGLRLQRGRGARAGRNLRGRQGDDLGFGRRPEGRRPLK